MSSDVWALRRDPAAKPDPIPEKKPARIAIALSGLEARRAFIYDTESPDLSPYPLDVVPAQPAATEVYATTFGLCFLDPAGKNVYAELSVEASGNVAFVKWVDGGANLEIDVDNETRPALITVKGKQD